MRRFGRVRPQGRVSGEAIRSIAVGEDMVGLYWFG